MTRTRIIPLLWITLLALPAAGGWSLVTVRPLHAQSRATTQTISGRTASEVQSGVDRETSVSSAQEQPPEPPPSPAPPAPDELEELYRRLYETHVRVARAPRGSAERDSLEAEREHLLEHIESLHRDDAIDRAIERERRAGRLRSSEERFLRQLEKLGEEIDWEELGAALESQSQQLGEVMTQLGEQLQNLDIELGPDRIEVDTETGTRLRWNVPPELKETIAEGIRSIGEELEIALQDSELTSHRKELRVLLDELPADLPGALLGRRDRTPRERKIVAQSIFKLGDDVEIAEDELVQGDVIVAGADVYVSGEIQGSAFLLGGDLFVEERGAVMGDAVSLGGRVRREEDAKVHGRVFDVGGSELPLGGSWGMRGPLAWLVHLVGVGVLIALLFMGYALAGDRIEAMFEHGDRNPIRTLSTGAFWLLIAVGGITVSSVGLIASVIGIPLVLVLVVGLALVLLLAYFVGCRLVGGRLLRLFGREARGWAPSLFGLAALEIPALVVLALSTSAALEPLAGGLRVVELLFRLLAISLGFGSVMATRLGGRMTTPSAPAMPEPVSATTGH
jgi:hypothetical protein